MLVHVTAQPQEQASPVLLDLRPPVRAESIDLRALVSHRTATQSSASMETVFEIFKGGIINFAAVLGGERLLGMCSRQETAALLGGRYGFSLWARKPIGQHLCKQETRIAVTMPIGDVLRAVFARPDKNFYDDVLLVDERGGFLGFIATETLFKVQNALLLTNIRELEERDRVIRHKNEQMETDLRMATELQQALMPNAYPSFPSESKGVTALRFYHRYLPASMMGGDFFHIARLSDGTAGICICDVMGHGVRAALITAMLRALIETHATEVADPGRFLTELNNEFTRIMKQTGTLVFATVLYCVINIGERGARFARAGHPAPLRVRRTAGEVQMVACGEGSSGPAMGLIPNARFNTTQAELGPGDFLLFFTDGVVEVENKAGSDFGIEGLRQSIRSNLDQPTESLLEAIISDVYKFADSTVLIDDACLVAAEM
ncbi:MAG TPA: SpoIIE family protein phosphatase [Candidatus Dormibacteraeota bacterium]|nr:SpoIIE family protein phosphatase [Candidatus Dormibacteraeota bacterium]